MLIKVSLLKHFYQHNSVASLQEEVKNSDGNSLKMIDSLSDEKAGVLKTNERIDLYDALKIIKSKRT